MNVTKQIMFHLVVIGLLLFSFSCRGSYQSQSDLEVQKKTIHPYLQKQVKKFGSPNQVELEVRNGDQYDSLEISNVDHAWNLLASCPSWYATASADDFVQGMSPSPIPSWIFEFTLANASGKTFVRFEIVDNDAMCFVGNKGIDLMDISENLEAIGNLIDTTEKGQE